jgi:hypothetical protein
VSPALKYLGTAFLFVGLTTPTQVGGLAYLLGLAIGFIPPLRHYGLWLRRTTVVLASAAIYVLMTAFLVPALAQSTGRIRLPCSTHGDGLVVAATPLTSALNRGYVRPEVLALVEALGGEVAQRFPGSRVTTLEGNFPFLDGFPLLPHLSHRDGKKVDVAYFYFSGEESVAVAHGSPSRLGYFIYEQPRQGDPLPCAGRWTPLRWNFEWFQPQPPKWRLDEQRTAWMLTWLKGQEQVSRIFIEPHLAQRLDVAGGKVRFQGCQAARHDDHIHIEIF